MTDIYDIAGEPRRKFCRDCKHIGRNGSGDASRFQCFAPQNIIQKDFDLVTGEAFNRTVFASCYDARLYHEYSCGPEAKWFEPTPPKFIDSIVKIDTTGVRKTVADNLLSQLDKLP